MNTEPESAELPLWEVTFNFVIRKECRAVVRAANLSEAEAIIESMSSDVIEYGIDTSDEHKFQSTPDCMSEDETVEDIESHGPFTEEDF